MHELFSSFTAKYVFQHAYFDVGSGSKRDRHDDIQDMVLNFACTKARNVVAADIYNWLNNIFAEDFKHRVIIVARLVRRLLVDNIVEPGRLASPAPSEAPRFPRPRLLSR